ncbi:hypothetical protein [Paenibacillus eucommiae]|uniref:Uncharacterized protein n=1 Tax=Paenibacillus eucommiae TaxID=1355755 RepID=A0ABS4J6F8_9BACL|nr:hypothetical protein [Paenibacillus eucommiae]MBP1994846.1 hypothetical protein [Paenibacillus eucommiae]
MLRQRQLACQRLARWRDRAQHVFILPVLQEEAQLPGAHIGRLDKLQAGAHRRRILPPANGDEPVLLVQPKIRRQLAFAHKRVSRLKLPQILFQNTVVIDPFRNKDINPLAYSRGFQALQIVRQLQLPAHLADFPLLIIGDEAALGQSFFNGGREL